MSDVDEQQVEKEAAAEAKRLRRLYDDEIKFANLFRTLGKRIEFFDRNAIAALTGKIICGIHDDDVAFARENRARLFNPYLKAYKKEGNTDA